MKLNHLNLAVTDVAAARTFFETYFGLRSMGKGNDKMAGLIDDNGFVLVLMKVNQEPNVTYPAGFHIGFTQESEEKVTEINQCLRDAGFNVPPPQRMHGAWAFYFQAPGEFTIEVSC